MKHKESVEQQKKQFEVINGPARALSQSIVSGASFVSDDGQAPTKPQIGGMLKGNKLTKIQISSESGITGNIQEKEEEEYDEAKAGSNESPEPLVDSEFKEIEVMEEDDEEADELGEGEPKNDEFGALED
mmetsp:Transcript_18690/g.28622  ORF Transcript_18690/g.28622 Transcript_18690/m.28622 type:complete len:130 (+) Transcript_18690:783-1172(+)